jgi:ketosteroid isomerase-like protein
MYHAVDVDDGRITRIADYADRADALAATGLKND